MSAPVFIVLTPAGEALARRLAADLDGSEVHGLRTRTDASDVPFNYTMDHLRALFQEGRTIVGVCAAGILIRALAPVLQDKRTEPAVVALAEDGSVVVPLLGGHHGANRLARYLAETLDVAPAITTAGDVGLGMALDEPPSGWRVANAHLAKQVAASALSSGEVHVQCDDGVPPPSGLAFKVSADGPLRLSTAPAKEDTLTWHPQVFALGVGCERGCDPDELKSLVEETLSVNDLAAGAVACVVSLDLKADEEAVLALADVLGVPARFFDAATLEAETPRLKNPSDVVFAEVGCHGVSEAAALAAAGRDADLIVEKTKSKRATCAITRAPSPIDPFTVGRARGRLSIVGIGPGQASWRTPEVTSWLAGVTDVVGYGLYLDLLGPLIDGKARHMSNLSEEEARVRRSLELAAEGRDVALVSSGDAGIYAMAALAFEVLDRDNDPAFNRVEIRVSPGISAVQAAAARIGAPLGHDFALISLSDLLTPWDVIENRIKAAAAGDFTVAFYNPVSKRRRTQLVAAKEILLSQRPADTVVVLARNLGRDDETITVLDLGDLDVDMVDMLTLVLIGATSTKHIERGGRDWVYTPRGYAKKMEGS